MTTRTTTVAAIALAALLATACGGNAADDADAMSAGSTAASPTSVVASPAKAAPGDPAPDGTAPDGAASDTQTPVPAPARPPSVPCVDPSSPVVQDAVAGLWAPFETGWRVTDHTPGTSAEGCPTISWALASDTVTGNGTYVSHVMFFHKEGRYIGQASGKPYSYTTVVGATDTTVDVRYNWITGGDALCCPTGGPSVMTFEYDGVTMGPSGDTGHFPPSQP